DTVDPKAFRRSSDMISVSQGIYVLGVKSSAVLASFMAYYLSLLFKDVKVLNGASSDEIAQQLYRMEGSDLLIAISFPRYSNRTISAMKFANSRGLRSIAITDSPDSPIASYATLPLYADCGVISYVDSIVPPMSLINALLVDVGEKMSKSADKELSELEGIWSEYGSYSSRNTP
ncbi:MAG: MurR/RpiR family transcriptional regulator, partial [Oscillospiraceae bacterium]